MSDDGETIRPDNEHPLLQNHWALIRELMAIHGTDSTALTPDELAGVRHSLEDIIAATDELGPMTERSASLVSQTLLNDMPRSD